MENHNKQSGLIASIKFLIVSVSVTAAVWLWSIFSNQALQSNTNKQSNTSNTQPQTAMSPVSIPQNTQNLPTVNIQPNANQPTAQVQPVTMSPSTPITSTGSSR